MVVRPPNLHSRVRLQLRACAPQLAACADVLWAAQNSAAVEVRADILGALQRMTSDVTLLHECLVFLEFKPKSGMSN